MKLVIETPIRAPRERCFDLARSIDFHAAEQSHHEERPVAGVTSGLIGPDQEVTWEATHLFVRQRLTSKMVRYDRPSHFRDSMVKGAFKRFDHDHEFRSQNDGQGDVTLMRDVFDFASPFGPIGWLVDRLFLGRYMRRFLEDRALAIKRAAESDAWRSYVPA